MTEQERFMKEAVRQAKKARALMEVPIGCVIVSGGKIIARGYNRRNTDKNTLSHAELNAILNHASGTGSLRGARIYTTLFPCNECAKALIQSGIREVIYYEDKYPDSDSVIASKRMFDLVGITYKHYEKSGRSVALQL